MFETGVLYTKYCKFLQISRRKVHWVSFCLFEGILQQKISCSYYHILHSEVTVEHCTVCDLRLTLPFDTNDLSNQCKDWTWNTGVALVMGVLFWAPYHIWLAFCMFMCNMCIKVRIVCSWDPASLLIYSLITIPTQAMCISKLYSLIIY
jgi:hypothetical protein